MNHEGQYYESHIFTGIFWEFLHVDSKINIHEYANAYANFIIYLFVLFKSFCSFPLMNIICLLRYTIS